MKKGHMRPRNIGIILALLMFFLFGSMAHKPTASAGKKKKAPIPAFLSQKSLRGAMQGMSGAALDLNDDGLKDLVVGAPLAQHRGSTGALLVYLATAKGFHKKPSAILRGDGNLGWSLVSLGDVNGDGREDFAAGAHSGNGEYSSLAGTVTIYYGGDKPQKAFVLEGERAMDKFGFALAAGDLNDDEFTDIVVGAPLHSPDPSLYQQGAVYIYFGGLGPDDGPFYGPSHAVKISASNVNRGIGFSLAVGDIINNNYDGVDDLLMGASGKVIGYTGGSGFPSTAGPDLVFSSKDRGFGRAISVIWNVDGDEYNDVAVGAYQAQIDKTDIGRLFILKGGEKNRTLDLDADPPPPDLLIRIDGEPNCGQFATAILPLGDVDGDGAPELAVSAVHADGEPWAMTGKIFIFSGSTLTDAGTTVDSARSIAGDARDMHLGTFLAMVGDGSWLAAGAPTEKANTGRVRLYDLAPPESNSKREKK
jgi:hypothetical protein